MRKKKETLRIYFDCETFNYYPPQQTPTKKKPLPFIVPYLIGACTDEPNSYVVFKGTDSTEQFIKWLFHMAHGKTTILYAFNVDYDFQAIKPHVIELFPELKIEYHLTSKKKFVYGSFNCKKLKINILIKDLWCWDKSKSLSAYYDEISKIAKTNQEYQKLLDTYEIKNLSKLSIEDYYKKNLRPHEGNFIYEDENDITKTLDIERELEYLKYDVIGLPIVFKHIQNFRHICIDLLKLNGKINDKRLSKCISIPGFGKQLLGYFICQEAENPGEIVDQVYRCKTTIEDYYTQDMSYFGGFVANNPHLTRVLNQVDSKGNPKIVSVDVNSMYPWVMSEGVPCGMVSTVPLPGVEGKDYICWYSIYFEKQITPGELYRYKDKYQCFNNKFFGDSYFKYVEEAGEHTLRTYISADVYRCFTRACDSHVKIKQVYYQPLNHDLKPYIEFLYTKKENPDTPEQRTAIKLIMNALYGKFAERHHEDYYAWNNLACEFRNICDIAYDRNSILAGLFITSKSRVRLFSAILDEIDNGNTFLGCDTDSIKLIQNNPLTLKLHDSALGYWGLEGYYTDFVHNNKKKKYYMYDSTGKSPTKMATSGVPKRILKTLKHEDLITVFSEESDVLFKDCKNVSRRNELWQICIKKASVRFNYMKGRPITHIYENGKLKAYE